MNDAPTVTVTSIDISDPHNTPVVFANSVIGSGHLNGVINITLGTARFSPTHDGKIATDLVISARLRLDMACAEQLAAQLGKLIEQMTQQNGTTKN